jgi:hypothetical protein
MATTTNFSWTTPDDTDLVKDGAAAIRTLGSAIDTSLVDLKGGTTGQVLSKTSGTDMDFTWISTSGGKVLQVVSATYSTAVANSTNVYADTGLTASITPSLATSKVAVFVTQNGLAKNSSNALNAVNIQLLRDATQIAKTNYIGYTEATTANFGFCWAMSYLDSPATTSSTTYKTQFKNNYNGSGVEAQYNSATSSIILMEIGV